MGQRGACACRLEHSWGCMRVCNLALVSPAAKPEFELLKCREDNNCFFCALMWGGAGGEKKSFHGKCKARSSARVGQGKVHVWFAFLASRNGREQRLTVGDGLVRTSRSGSDDDTMPPMPLCTG